MTDCERARALLIDFLKHELPPDVAEDIEHHLEKCPPCDSHARFERRFVLVLEKRLGVGCCPEQLKTRIIEALRREASPS